MESIFPGVSCLIGCLLAVALLQKRFCDTLCDLCDSSHFFMRVRVRVRACCVCVSVCVCACVCEWGCACVHAYVCAREKRGRVFVDIFSLRSCACTHKIITSTSQSFAQLRGTDVPPTHETSRKPDLIRAPSRCQCNQSCSSQVATALRNILVLV